jgi:topoisomerase-4 subunit B
MLDLFSSNAAVSGDSYAAEDIEVLEGLEPVRRRPGMYIGGTDEKALHHLVGEVLDNAMDEAVAGFANRIEIELAADNSVTVRDNGRGIPVDNHPKYPGKSALEVIMTTLHSGGKFGGKAYMTSGGLHGVGISVVNALSDWMWIEVARDRKLYRQSYSRGQIETGLENLGPVNNRRGTVVCFHPDPQIFGEEAKFKPAWLYQMARSKAYLFRGVEIRWKVDPSLLKPESKITTEETFHFPNGLLDYLKTTLEGKETVTNSFFHGEARLNGNSGKVEYAITWPRASEGFIHSYCNTVPTSQGGTHETGIRTALSRALKQYGEMIGNRRASQITADDVMNGAAALVSVFLQDPQFQGQTKERLANPEAARWVDAAVKDQFDHWLSADPAASRELLNSVIERAEERQRRRESRQLSRKSATRKLRLPGKLADCSRSDAEGTELFIVEGDSAGGSAKQARNREIQAVLPLRGKILNVVSATKDKIRANQEIQDIVQALGCSYGKDFNTGNLRYERIIIMTDADVDGAHIASLLITFFYTQMRELVERGHLYLAQPPLYRMVSGNISAYARDEKHRQELLETTFRGKNKVETSRFKGLGEMPAAQLRETTMSPDTRSLIRVSLPDAIAALGLSDDLVIEDNEAEQGNFSEIDDLIERLMGRNAESRFKFIQENAQFVQDVDI